MGENKYILDISKIKEVNWVDVSNNNVIMHWDRENGLTYPTPIKNITIYEGIGLLEITDDFKPKGLIEKFDYWCYKQILKKQSK